MDTELRDEVAKLVGRTVSPDLSGRILPGFVFDGAQWEGPRFRFGDFKGASFQNTHLYRADFTRANAANACFTDAYLERAGFDSASLRNADFSRANLKGATVAYANLTDANFSDANLSGLNLVFADVSGANFHNANLNGAGIGFLEGEDSVRGLVHVPIPNRRDSMRLWAVSSDSGPMFKYGFHWGDKAEILDGALALDRALSEQLAAFADEALSKQLQS